MKKVLSLVLALTMILSCFTVAFAAPEDITDKNQVKAVDALMSLGIVNGYTDGSYKPENTVTRAEMAKLLVTALGHGDLAQGSESSFKDAKGKWYDGFVAMAAGLDLVTGYPDGTFKGDNPVSYQEAIVMTLRALGYNNSAVNNGVNAYNASKYKALGANLGLLKDVTFKNSGANRGDIAVIVYNALECETVKINEKGLAEKIVAYTYEQPITGTNKTKVVTVNEVLLDRLTDREDVNVTPESLVKTNKNYLGNLVDLTPYMYQNITAYLNDDGYVVFVKRSNNTTVTGTVNGIRTTDVQWDVVANKTKIFVLKEDKSTEKVQFPVAATGTASINVYLNGAQKEGVVLADLQRGGSLNGAEITLVLDDNDVIKAAVAKKQSADPIQIKKAYKAGSTTLGSIKLPKDTSNKVVLDNITVTGAVTSLEDIAVDDIVTPFAAAGNNDNPAKIELIVSRDTVEGKITGTSSGYYYVIDGNSYDFYCDLNVGDEGTFYLDYNGDIVAFVGKSISNADYAIITKLSEGVTGGTPVALLRDASVRILGKDAKSTTYAINANAKYELTNTAGVKGTATNIFSDKANQKFEAIFATFRDNKFVVTGFEVNSANEITLITVQQLTTSTVNPASKTFVAADDVVIFSSYDSDNNGSIDTFKVNTVNDLEKVAKTTYYTAFNKNGEFALIIADEQLVDASSYGIITAVDSTLNDSNNVVSKVTAYIDGQKVEYLTNTNITVPDAVGYRAQLFSFPLENGKIAQSIAAGDAITDARLTVTTESAIKTVNVQKSTFSLNGQRKALADNVAVYVWTQSTATGNYGFSRVGDISDLELENATFQFYNLNPSTDTNGDIYEVVIIKVAR